MFLIVSLKAFGEFSFFMQSLKPWLSLALVVVIVMVGYAGASAWFVFPLTALFAAAYIDGKWYAWEGLFRQGGSKLYRALLVTYLIDLFVVLALYLLGVVIAYFVAYVMAFYDGW